MEREIWVRAGMFAAVIALVTLILATPSLLGHPPSLAPPLLIVGIPPDHANLTVYVAASVQATLYDEITVNLTRLGPTNASVGWTNVSERFTYGVETRTILNLTYWHVHVWLRDGQGNYFETNLTVRIYNDPNNSYKLTMAFTFPDDKSTVVVTRVPPDDYRVAIPRRGTLP